jgi:hypothetical protein
MIRTLPVLLTVSAIAFASCKASEYTTLGKSDQAKMMVAEKKDAVEFKNLQQQSITTFKERTQTRTFFAPMIGVISSYGVDAIKKMIANDKKKYTAEYKMALTDMVFYDQLSTESAFDPIGMQFNGFTLVRTFKNENGGVDTAMKAEFELDKTNPYEILNNAIFRLKLKSFTLNYAKAKIAKNGPKKLNMDFEITFKTSYVNEQGVLFDNVTLGKFVFLLRDAPLDKNSEGYTAYYEKLKGKKIDGRSFIVPRSFGYYITEDGGPAKSYSQGAYAVQVTVKESSKNSFVNTLLLDNSGQVLDAAGKKITDLGGGDSKGKSSGSSGGKKKAN